MSKLNRREFVGTAVAATGACVVGGVAVDNLMRAKPVESAPAFIIDRSIKNPGDQVRLGRSAVKVSVVGIGTGSIGYGRHSNQTRLGQDNFTKLMRHSLDQGINFFDLADAYGSHTPFKLAMKGVPRDRYVIQTKSDSRNGQFVREDIDRFLRELETDYIDSLIIHHVTIADWPTRYREVMDVFSDAKKQGKIRACGITCHDFGALQSAAASDWVEINQVRWNPRESHMDGNVETMRSLFSKMRAKGQGMIGMKVVGQGDIVDGDRALSPADCFKFQVESGVVDAFVVGVESISQIDQLLSGTKLALNEVGYRVMAA
ncbi:MAG: aldo/keto reductase [Blastocatellia bacterium]|nr:MAG: aldo/keto reductase [Blastocatellia bacterium]